MNWGGNKKGKDGNQGYLGKGRGVSRDADEEEEEQQEAKQSYTRNPSTQNTPKKPSNPFLVSSEESRPPRSAEKQTMEDVIGKFKNNKKTYGQKEGT